MLRPYQQQALEAMKDSIKHGLNPVADLPTGCHAKGTLILMYDGSTKAVEDVIVGDLLMGDDSTPRAVFNLFKGSERLYKITPTRGEPFTVNESHILSLERTNESVIDGKSGNIVNIAVKDYLSQTKYFKHLHKLYRRSINLQEKELLLPPYIVGALLGDGSLCGVPAITTSDPEIVEQFTLLAESYGCYINRQKSKNTASTYYAPHADSTCSIPNPFTEVLKKEGIFGQKCELKHVPFKYKTGSIAQRLEVIAGLLDTDGCLTHSGFDFISKSKQLSEDLVFLCRSVGLAAYLSECTKTCQNNFSGIYYRVSVSGNCEIIPNKVLRRKATPRKQKKNPLRTGFTIEPIGIGEYFGFNLSGNHLYLTSDFTVHHNSGKSHVLMGLAEWVVSFEGKRCLILAHRKELLEQNSQKTSHDVAFYSAGLGIKDLTSSPIIIAGIQSIYKLEQLPIINLLIIDECHRIPHDDDSMFMQLINKLLAKNPKMRIAGFTATPYNLAPVFNHTAYSIGIGELIEQGFLCPLKSRISNHTPNLEPVPIVLGDYVVSKLGEAMMDAELVAETIKNIMWYGQNHYSWLVFCVNVRHTEVICEAIRDQGIFVEMLTGETPSEERTSILKRFKAREVQCLVNCEVLTTGFDAPNVDMLVMLRPTQSRTLYVQMVGRGTRLYPEKDFCLVLDHADNINTHGTITNLLPIDKRVSKGEANTYTHRRCPQCEAACEIKEMQCQECGYEFPKQRRVIDHDGKPADLDIMGDGGKWHSVHYVSYNSHIKKGTQAGEAPPTMRVTYICGTEEFSEWVCVEHPERGVARRRAVKWLQERNNTALPSSVQEALGLKYKEPLRIRVVPEGQYKRISAYEFEAFD